MSAKLYERVCPVCFKHFTTNYSFKKYCSGRCRIIDHNRKLVAAAKIIDKECPHCHKHFKTTSRKRVYCSAKCRVEAQNERKRDGRLGLLIDALGGFNHGKRESDTGDVIKKP